MSAQDLQRLVEVVRETLLVRQGQVLTPTIALERARNIVTAIQGEFDLAPAGDDSEVRP